MSKQTTAGTCLYIGPVPATNTVAGYEAVAFEQVSEVTSIGAIAKNWNTATHTELCSSRVTELKTSYSLPAIEIPLASDETNAGQEDAELANNEYTFRSIQVKRQDGRSIYLTAQVSAFSMSFDTDSFENGSITLLPQTEWLRADA